jgi:hypothetical protein
MMNASELAIGQRVVTSLIIDIFPLGIWPIGTCGTVVSIEKISHQTVAYVKLDDEYTCLAEWDNCLVAWDIGHEDNSDATLASFEVLS